MKPAVALVRPRYRTHIITPPLGLGYLASALRGAGHPVAIVDALRDRLDDPAIAARVADCPVVGISCLSDHHRQTVRTARFLAERGKAVVLGGPHATALPRESLAETGARAVFVGEAERSLPLALSSWPGIGPAAGVVQTADDAIDPQIIDDLDALPEPAWDLMRPGDYPIAPHGAIVRRFPVAPLVTSRGCAFRCTFCTAPRLHRRTVRFRDPVRVVDEAERLAREFGVREIHFEDNNLTARASHVRTICEELLRRGLDLSWGCPNGVRVEHLDDDTLRLMKRSGCYMLAFGIESGSQALLDGIKKDVKLETVLGAVRRARRIGIATQGFFIFGLPGETRETIEATIRTAVSSGLDRAQFHLLDVLPGSEMWDAFGSERIGGWERRGFQQVVWVPPGLSERDLVRAQKRAFRRFYLRPRILWSFLRHLKGRQIPHFWRRLVDFGIVRAPARSEEG